ncbi:hypothetical protein GOP47_0014670 [Adiantum capillus-veneris]|uniref:Uncharacterized protein n=1 Tax=Adiantum capillus-veneris TaxID=13818 RepID=A0A9D4ZDQ3_ADICA|nr:hypothetical protein GOP47_0014670 [Adiantum capillus-veneris]
MIGGVLLDWAFQLACQSWHSKGLDGQLVFREENAHNIAEGEVARQAWEDVAGIEDLSPMSITQWNHSRCANTPEFNQEKQLQWSEDANQHHGIYADLALSDLTNQVLASAGNGNRSNMSTTSISCRIIKKPSRFIERLAEEVVVHVPSTDDMEAIAMEAMALDDVDVMYGHLWSTIKDLKSVHKAHFQNCTHKMNQYNIF